MDDRWCHRLGLLAPLVLLILFMLEAASIRLATSLIGSSAVGLVDMSYSVALTIALAGSLAACVRAWPVIPTA